MKISELPKLNDLRPVTALSHLPVMDVTRRMAMFNIGVVVVVDDRMDIGGVLLELQVARRDG